METVQVQPRQTGIEVSAPGNDEIDIRNSNGGLVVVRSGKHGCAVLRHSLRLARRTTPHRNAAIAKRAGWRADSDVAMRLRKLEHLFVLDLMRGLVDHGMC